MKLALWTSGEGKQQKCNLTGTFNQGKTNFVRIGIGFSHYSFPLNIQISLMEAVRLKCVPEFQNKSVEILK